MSSLPEITPEFNFDGYVAAPQLLDCDDCQPNIGDSDRESDYFGD